ncbi:5'/3'-nucleotidase SurE [Sphingomonas oryzagri]|uniref:5'-nucleotidase SurE n=1 Tax=Sphingomonas oryzagri TaxID=3042314 RepID=A0ABT6MXN9_9SPHN|nr:5'/3'-nucleotidase SurE [Sphingomonas oryzagri]MDH7637823.1 5'/3'-nucleotidase SurE [Sphingomonas oryzagri]
MRILVTNDDGIHARGLKVAEAIARTLSDDVWVVAPMEEQSGAGHSLTLTRPLRLRKHAERRFSVSGTPTDTVMMALLEVMDGKPDLILSGVNRGANLGEDATYSGTISAAMEGALAGVRSIALSQVYAKEGAGEDVPFAAAEAWGERAIRPLLDTPFAPGMLASINFPALPPEQVEGIRVVAQGMRDYGRAKMIKHTDPRGFPYYWLSFNGVVETGGDDTDFAAIRSGYVTVTPLHLDLTYRDALAQLAASY